MTHLSYVSLKTRWSLVADTIWLDPLVNDLAAIQVVLKAPAKHKRYLRQFKSALLGKTKNGKNSTILNPEVLQYAFQKGKLLVESNQIIKIDIPSTGYIIDGLLEAFSLNDDEVNYSIKPFFVSYPNPSKSQINERKKTFKGSYYHFIKHLITNSHKQAGYTVKIVSKNADGRLRVLGPGLSSNLVKTVRGQIQLTCSALIQVLYKYENDLLSEREAVQGDLSGLGQAAEVDMMGQEKKNLTAGGQVIKYHIYSSPLQKQSLIKMATLLNPIV